MAQRRLNKNVIAGFTFFLFAAIIVLSVVMVRRLQQRDPKHFVALAEGYRDTGEWQQAGLLYIKAWERSEDPVFLVRYGEMMLNQGEIRPAVDSWRRALIKKPDLIPAHVRLIDLLVELAKLDGTAESWRMLEGSAKAFLEVDPSLKSPAEQAQAHWAYGLALTQLAEFGAASEDGTQHLQEALRLAPEVADIAIDLASYYVRSDRSAEAGSLFEQLLAQYKESGSQAVKVRVAYAKHLAAKGQFEAAEKIFQDALAAAQHDAEALLDTKLAFASFQMQQWGRTVREDPSSETAKQHFVRAESLLQECPPADDKAFDAAVQLATLYTAAGRHEDVLKVCEAPLAAKLFRKGLDSIRKRLNVFNIALLASEACSALALTAGNAGDKAQEQAWFTEAEEYVARARGELPNHPRALAQSGRVKLARGQDRAALEDLRAAEEGYRTYKTVDWQNKMLLARLHLKLSEAGAAQALLDEVFEQARSVRAKDSTFWTLYGQVLLFNNELDRAMAMCEQALSIDRGNRDALALKAAIYERKGRLSEAGELHAQLTGSGVVRALLQVRELEQAGQLEEGLAVLREVLRQNPTDRRLVTSAVRTLIKAGRFEEASDVVSKALALQPDDSVMRKLAVFARPGLTDGQRDAALLEIIESEPDAFQRAWELAGLAVRKGELAAALTHLDEAERHLLARDTPMSQMATSSQHRELLVHKLRVATQLKNEAASDQVLVSAAKQNVDGAGGKSILGLYHVYREEMEPAIRALRDAVEEQPTDAESLAYLGHCLNNIGRTDDAQIYFERAVSMNPDEALAHRGLAAIAQVRGDKAAYENALAVCRRLTPDDPWVQAEMTARQEQSEPGAAIAQREAQLADKPNDVENLKRLVRLCEEVKDLAKADKYFARLLDLRPNDSFIAISAARYFRRTQRPDRALEVLTRYAESPPTAEERAHAQILIAGHYVNQGQNNLAESTLLAAVDMAATLDTLQSLAEFYLRTADRPEKALPWFDRAVQIARETKSSQLPQILANRIGCLLHRAMNDTAAARKYVDELRRAYPDDLRGLYWDSEVYARTGSIEKAVATLSDFLRQRPNDASVLFQRARYQLSLGATGAALADLEQIKRTDPLALSLEPRILLAQLHGRSGREDAALRELENLVKDAPHAAKANEELARAYLRAKRFADAERVVTAQINRAGETPEARWLFLRGLIAFQAGDLERALADYDRAAKLNRYAPESLASVLDMYKQTGRFAAGVDYYQRHAPTAPTLPALQSRYAVLLARAGKTTDAVEQFRQAMDRAGQDSLAAARTVSQDVLSSFAPNDGIRLFEADGSNARLRRANDRILSSFHRSAGRTEESDRLLERCLSTAETAAERAGLLYERGEMYQLAGDAAKARAAYEESLRLDETNWATLNNLAYLLAEKLGEFKLALPYAKKAVAIADTPDTLDTLGWVYVGLGDFASAIAELSRAVRLDPTQALLYYHLGEAYRRNGQFLEAGDLFQRGLEVARAANDQAMIESLTASLTKTTQRERAP